MNLWLLVRAIQKRLLSVYWPKLTILNFVHVDYKVIWVLIRYTYHNSNNMFQLFVFCINVFKVNNFHMSLILIKMCKIFWGTISMFILAFYVVLEILIILNITENFHYLNISLYACLSVKTIFLRLHVANKLKLRYFLCHRQWVETTINLVNFN